MRLSSSQSWSSPGAETRSAFGLPLWHVGLRDRSSHVVPLDKPVSVRPRSRLSTNGEAKNADLGVCHGRAIITNYNN